MIVAILLLAPSAGESIDNHVSWPTRIDMTMAIPTKILGFYDVEGATDFAVTLFRLFGGESDYPTDVIFGDYALQTYFPYSEYQRITLPIRPIFWSSPSESVVGTELEY